MLSLIRLLSLLYVTCLSGMISAETMLPSLQITDLASPVSLDSTESEASSWLAAPAPKSTATLASITEKNFSSLNWKKIRVPGNIIKQLPELQGKKEIILARWIQLPSNLSNNLSLRLGVINDCDEVFWNGIKIGATGDWNSKYPQAYDKIRIYPIPSNLVRNGGNHLLLIRVKPFFASTAGIEQDSTWIGHTDQILRKFYIDEFVKIIFLTVYLTVGVYFLFLFIRRKRQSENFYFALFSLCLVLYNLLRNQIKYEFGFSFLTMKRVEYCLLIMLLPLMFHFIRNLFEFNNKRLYKLFDALALCFILIFIIDDNIEHYDLITKNFIQPSWIFYVILILYFLIKRITEKNKQAYVVLIGLLFVMFASGIDIISTRGIIVFPRILGYAFLAFNISLALVLANSFVKVHEEVENLNKNLESKVEERTIELNQSLREVQNLKEQQDGDYFLTSLLINPLAKNENKSQTVITEFFTRQKKVFEFRGNANEIGGDISISDQIELNAKPYVVFINGDAMGKSIQGAGGALVLGVVFHAVVARTKANSHSNLEPEMWLKQLFLELQTTFESFDGSMLSSIVLGLVCEQSGLLYYVNAEHPWSILYRNKEAWFLESEMSMRKLGFPRNGYLFSVIKLQLLPGDQFICGSDGRDDLAILKDPNTEEKQINEDTSLILKWVEKSEANLQEIVNYLENFGELTDDLTFIKVTYKNTELPESQV
ncbi:stage II sporulation protein E [Leptospira ognonensis]|uniref:Stage II sporulation protein E n=1 Tax=Leptospira ognonensis TaxID=2484945 RepID=A0A4R9KB77_9LEPT|nr:SpoIIE family protein phosphatase [Leptospira ognonensis]TGL63977.1 stage II sporulation protein E [Leptospira ognonensis]